MPAGLVFVIAVRGVPLHCAVSASRHSYRNLLADASLDYDLCEDSFRLFTQLTMFYRLPRLVLVAALSMFLFGVTAVEDAETISLTDRIEEAVKSDYDRA